MDGQDDLYAERLDAFVYRYLSDIKAFAEREQRPYEETRKLVAESFCKYLFESSSPAFSERRARIQTVLNDLSQNLETLRELAGLESFLVAVDPAVPNSEPFLVGTPIGKGFWENSRNGGDAGARAFATYSRQHLAPSVPGMISTDGTSAPPAKSSKSAKTELYDLMRTSLRTVSGIRNAEMKWTQHGRLDIYGVCLVGWPVDIPTQNPSTLKAQQNKRLLELFNDGTLRFVRTLQIHQLAEIPAQPAPTPPPTPIPAPQIDYLSWAINDETE